MIKRIRLTLSSATLGDWLAAMFLALAVAGAVEAPWIAPHFVSQENSK